jgi:heparin/heparan-sulfate lyase
MNYLHRTIAGNCLLIEDPAEKWKGFLGGAEGGQDEGGERTNFPLSSSADGDTYRIYRDIFRRGQITRFRHTKDFTYALADLTPAYNNPRFHGGKLNQPKVDYVSRELMYLRGLDALVVFDRVNSSKPEFKKRWVLHSLGDLDVLDGTAKEISDGQIQYHGATRAVIRYGWPKPVPSFGRCLSVTLLPEHAQITKIGGRTELAAGQTETFPGDQWHGKHQHLHIKDFWVNGTNYPPGNPPETRWFGEPTSPDFIPGTPDESGGRGKWRIEVSPQEPALNDVFLHVLCPRLGREGPFPTVSKLSSITIVDGSMSEPFDGALIRAGSEQAVVFFCRSHAAESVFYAGFPPAPQTLLVVADLAPGDYAVTMANNPTFGLSVGADRVAAIPEAQFPVKLKHQ